MPSLAGCGVSETANERVDWTSGSCPSAATVSLSDSSSRRHSSHWDRWPSTRRRSESLTSLSMYEDSSSRSFPCLNLSNSPVKLIESP